MWPVTGLFAPLLALGKLLAGGLDQPLSDPVRDRDTRVAGCPADEVVVFRKEADPDGGVVLPLLGLRGRGSGGHGPDAMATPRFRSR